MNDWITKMFPHLAARDIPWDVVWEWCLAVLVFAAALAALLALKRILTRHAAAHAAKPRLGWGPAIAELPNRTKWWFLVILAAYAGSLTLRLAPRPEHVVDAICAAALLLQGAIWLSSLLSHSVARFVERQIEADAGVATTVSMVGFLFKVALWSVAILLILQNVGVNVTALVAGLGIGGIAIALAAQNILGDLFASLSIVLDKPFVLGDFIVVDQHSGTVEHIGVKTTRIRSLSGEQLIFSNGDLLKSRISNYKRMRERRVLFTVGVTYETPREKLAAVAAMLREIVEAQKLARFDRAHFKSFGDWALVFEVVYYVLDPDYNVYMDTQQAINLAIVEQFGRQGIDFAYPTQTIFLRQQAPST